MSYVRGTDYKGGVYEGEWHNKKPHGNGKLTYDGTIFVGRFAEGNFLNGAVTINEEIIYTGGWKNNEAYSRIECFDSGSTIVGMHGEGSFFDGGYKFTGQWREGKPVSTIYSENRVDGKQKCIYLDGMSYEGDFVEGKKEGCGTLKNSIGSIIYSGEWKEDMMHGKGEYLHSDSTVYVGDFIEGTAVGIGAVITNKNHFYITSTEQETKGLECIRQGVNYYRDTKTVVTGRKCVKNEDGVDVRGLFLEICGKSPSAEITSVSALAEEIFSRGEQRR